MRGIFAIMARRSIPKAKCLTCDQPSAVRGLCRACYTSARYAIHTGTTTEDDLVAKKLLLPKYSVPQSLFTQKLAKRRRREVRNLVQKCRTPDCDVTSVFERGFCKVCYKAAARLVELHLTTWEDLESRAPIKPANDNGLPSAQM